MIGCGKKLVAILLCFALLGTIPNKGIATAIEDVFIEENLQSTETEVDIVTESNGEETAKPVETEETKETKEENIESAAEVVEEEVVTDNTADQQNELIEDNESEKTEIDTDKDICEEEIEQHEVEDMLEKEEKSENLTVAVEEQETTTSFDVEKPDETADKIETETEADSKEIVQDYSVDEEEVIIVEPENLKLLSGVVDTNIPVQSLQISGQKVELKVGDKDYPVVTITPDTATNKNVTWTSKNTSVATVTSSGQVYAVGVGKTTITASAEENSNIFDIYVLEVKAAYDDDAAVKAVKITNGKANMRAGEMLALAFEVLPATAKNKSVSWSSSDPTVAKISEFGVITALAEGECTISLYSDENASIVDSYKLKVSGYVLPTSIKCWVTETPVIISETKTYYSAYEMLPADVSNTKVIWKSSDPSIVSVDPDNGSLKAHKGGKVIITATSELDPEVFGQYVINVYNKPVTGMSISGKGQMAVNETQTLIANIEPSDATVKGVNWSSSNEAIATISTNGVVKAISPGTVEITAVSADNSSIVAKKSITITANFVYVESVLVTGRTQLEVGDTSTLNAQITPSTATNQLLWWDSDNYSVATVDQTGTVTAHAPGTAVINAIATDGTLISGKATVTVKASVVHASAISVAGNKDVVLYPGAVYYSSYELWPASADDKSVSWVSSNPQIATVNPTNGTVKAVSTGNAEITAISNDDSSIKDSYVLYVKSSAQKVTKVAVHGKPTMGIGETYPLAYEIWPVDADIKGISWSSSDKSVATVSEYGVVTAIKEGTVYIKGTAVDGSMQSAELRIDISKTSNKVSRIEVHGAGSLSKGSIEYLAYEIWPVNASEKSVSWKSSNTKVATVSEYGVVNAISAGTTTITATAKDGSGVSADYTLNVSGTSVLVTALAIHGEPLMAIGSVQYMAYEAWPVNADDKSITWKSSNTNVAKIEATNGTVTALNVGNTVLTATANDGSGVAATFNLTVSNSAGTKKVTSLAIHGNATMKPNTVQYMAYEAWPVNATDKSITWTSSNTKVATVEGTNGTVRALTNGTTILTAKAKDGSGTTATFTLTVSNATTLVTALAIHGQSTMNKGDIQYMAYEVWPVNADDKSVSWTSSNPGVISVNPTNGTVNAIASGDAVLTMSANDGSGKTATFSIHVN